jgi:hypothetical protein
MSGSNVTSPGTVNSVSILEKGDGITLANQAGLQHLAVEGHLPSELADKVPGGVILRFLIALQPARSTAPDWSANVSPTRGMEDCALCVQSADDVAARRPQLLD